MGFFGRTSKTSGCVRIGALATAAVLALACHYFDDDDSGSSFVSPSQFEGSWLGTLRYATDGSAVDLALEFDADSNITSVVVDFVDQDWTGTLEFADPNPFEEFARFYDFELVDDTDAVQAFGSLYIDDRFEHGLLLYDGGDLAVVEKTVVPRPGPFAHEDLAAKNTPTRVLGVYVEWQTLSAIEGGESGDWVIATDVVDGGGDIPYRGMIGGDIEALESGQLGEKTLENGTPISGSFELTEFDPMGIWIGEDTPGDPEPLIGIMSFDKDFVGTIECDPNGFPDCIIGLWTRLSANTTNCANYPECAFND